MRSNVSHTNSGAARATNSKDTYEIKIGKTVYVIDHKYAAADMTDIIADYLAEKIPLKNKVKAA